MKRICHFQVKICISKMFHRNIFIWPRTYPIFVISQHYSDYSWLHPKLQRKSKLIRFKVSAPENYKWAKEGGEQLIFACFRGENGIFILKVICRGGILSCNKVEFCMLPGTKWIFHFKSHFQGGGNSFLKKKVISWKRWRLCRLKPHFWVKVAKS